jgi:hypothetical protein
MPSLIEERAHCFDSLESTVNKVYPVFQKSDLAAANLGSIQQVICEAHEAIQRTLN